MEQQLDFVKQRLNRGKLVCRPNKSIYVLKQAANNWYKELAICLRRQGSADVRTIIVSSR